MRIIVDADACPVKDIIIDLAKSNRTPVILVSSINHYSLKEYPNYVSNIYVEHGVDSADFKIVQLVKDGDLVVTQDYGLASLLLGKNCRIIHHLGFEYSNKNIDQMLQTRYLSVQARKSGQKTKGPAPLKDEDRQAFKNILASII